MKNGNGKAITIRVIENSKWPTRVSFAIKATNANCLLWTGPVAATLSSSLSLVTGIHQPQSRVQDSFVNNYD